MVEVQDEETGKARREPTGRSLMAVIKCNVAEPEERQTLAFTIHSKHLQVPPFGELKTSTVEWNEVVGVSARDIWDGTGPGDSKKPGPEPKRMDEAMGFILSQLFSHNGSNGKPIYRDRKSDEVHDAARVAGIKDRTYEAAKKKLGVRAEKREGGAYWLIPDELNSRQAEIPF